MINLDVTRLFNLIYSLRQKIADTTLEIFGIFYVKIYFAVIILLNLASWAIAGFIVSGVGQNAIVFLHYNVDFGVNLIGGVKQIYTLPLLGLSVLAFNFILLVHFLRFNKFIAHLLMSSVVLVHVIIIISLLLNYLINFR